MISFRSACEACFAMALTAVLFLGTAPAEAARWDRIQNDGCINWGKRKYSAKLLETSEWEKDCRRTAAKKYGKPTDCVNAGLFGMWGVWIKDDNKCKARWDTPKKDDCLRSAAGYRQWSAILRDIPKGMSWKDACKRTSVKIDGKDYPAPTDANCDDLGVLGMWGRWNIQDDSCKAYWSPPKKEACVSNGKRRYSARLENVPPGRDWAAACMDTSIEIDSVTYRIKDPKKDCHNYAIAGMWGVWEIDDESCSSSWETPKTDACMAPNWRQVSAKLKDAPADWLDGCRNTELTYQGENIGTPLRCDNHNIFGMWGVWAVQDNSCEPARWGTPKKDYCTGPNERQYSSQLHDIPGEMDWEIACRVTPAKVNDQDFHRPTRCANEGIGGMWGEFSVPDNSCARDERSDGDRKRDAELEAIDEQLKIAGDIHEIARVYDLSRLPGGASGKMLKDILNSEVVRAEGYDVAAFMNGAGGALVLGYEHMQGVAMVREGPGRFSCYDAWSNAGTGGIAFGLLGASVVVLVNGGIDAFAGHSNGLQTSVTYSLGYTAGIHWTAENNPRDPIPNVVVYGFGVAGSGLEAAFEYSHAITGLGNRIDCSKLP